MLLQVRRRSSACRSRPDRRPRSRDSARRPRQSPIPETFRFPPANPPGDRSSRQLNESSRRLASAVAIFHPAGTFVKRRAVWASRASARIHQNLRQVEERVCRVQLRAIGTRQSRRRFRTRPSHRPVRHRAAKWSCPASAPQALARLRLSREPSSCTERNRGPGRERSRPAVALAIGCARRQAHLHVRPDAPGSPASETV